MNKDLTTAQAVEFTGLSKNCIKRAVKRNRIEGTYLVNSRLRLFTKTGLNKWMIEWPKGAKSKNVSIK